MGLTVKGKVIRVKYKLSVLTNGLLGLNTKEQRFRERVHINQTKGFCLSLHPVRGIQRVVEHGEYEPGDEEHDDVKENDGDPVVRHGIVEIERIPPSQRSSFSVCLLFTSKNQIKYYNKGIRKFNNQSPNPE